MEQLDLVTMAEIRGGTDDSTRDRILGFSCGVAAGLGIFAAGFVTGGTAWLVGGAIAGPACAAAVGGMLAN